MKAVSTHDVSGWPVLRTYDATHLRRIALPLGGIGTGTVSLGGRGHLCDWELANRPAKGFIPVSELTQSAFFCLWVKPPAGPAVTRVLEGILDEADFEGARGSPVPNHGLPRFRHCTFSSAYPLGQVHLTDPDVPLRVHLEAFNPLVPADANASGIPMAVLRYVLTNPTADTLEASVCGMIPNFIGSDGSHHVSEAEEQGHRCEFRRGAGLHGVYCEATTLNPQAEAWGTLALSVAGQTDKSVSHRTRWRRESWGANKGGTITDFWGDFSTDGRLDECNAGPLRATLAARVDVPPGATRTVTFLLTWHFPNRKNWHPQPGRDDQVGNYYTTQYRDAWDVAEKTAAQLGSLESRTVQFVSAFCSSTLPQAVKEAALNNLSTLRSQTCWRAPDGTLFGWEGSHDRNGSCYGNCTHVWGYESALGFLFGDLSRSMRRVEFLHAIRANGLMSFRIDWPPSERGTEYGVAAADGQMASIIRAYRDWALSGDHSFLREIWPSVRRAMEFCWIPGGWDADGDGVMEGCQHNTMDVEYFGPNPQMAFWYLGGLRATEEMARQMGENEFAEVCHRRFLNGSRWIDQHLYNGEYYEQQIRPPASQDDIAPGLISGMGSANLADPDFQLGSGCLTDQLVGQYQAHAAGLGYLADPAHIQSALKAVFRHNFRENFFGHFNPMRSYALNDEAGLLMATWPRGKQPGKPFPYHSEVMSGFEYVAAIGMLFEGQHESGLRCIKAIRDRYEGRRRNPFDEAEAGHHYVRPLASWAAVLALSGFSYSAVTQTMTFALIEGCHFWSTGSAWGTCTLQPCGKTTHATLHVIEGTINIKRFEVHGADSLELNPVTSCVGPATHEWDMTTTPS